MSCTERVFYTLTSTGYNKIVYSDWGDADAPPVVCAHGLTGNGRDFDVLAEALAATGKRVIAVDLFGRGRSDFLPNPLDYCYRQYLHDLNALLLDAGINTPRSVDWIGTSLGGLLGIRIAALENSPIKRLTLNDIGPFVPKDQLNWIHKIVAQDYRFDTIHDLEKFMRSTRGLSWGVVTDDQWQAMAENNARPLPDGAVTYAFDPHIARVFEVEPVGDADLWASWDAIDIPVFALRGGKSLIFPLDIAEAMLHRGAGAKGLMTLETLPDCGHVPSLMADDQIEMIKTWLAK